MNTIFDNQIANDVANSLMNEITHILDVLENIDDLMPSSSLEQKMKVNSKIKNEFIEMSEYSISFLDERIGRFKEDMKSIKGQVGDSNSSYRQIADAVVITVCKILQFQIGKVSWFVNQRKFWLDKELFKSNYDLLYDIKRHLYSLSEFDASDTGRNEVIKTDRSVIKISKRLNPNSFFTRLVRKL